MLRKKTRVNIIGAGVNGLTTGLVLQKNGYEVKIIAEHWPGDFSINYSSPWAGAHIRPSFELDEKGRKLEEFSYNTLWALSYINDTGVIRIPGFDMYAVDPQIDSEQWLRSILHKFQVIPKDKLPEGVKYGVSYITVSLDVPKYLRWLLNQFTNAGGEIKKAHLNHLNDAFEPDVDIIVNCTGINARTFGGVKDNKVFSTRGQLVIVWAPHIKFTKIFSQKDGSMTYIIPRENGEVVLGGTLDVNEYDETPDPKTAEKILSRCVKLCPELHQGKGLSSLQIIRHIVGLRPSREGGIRLETEIRKDSGKNVIVCHNYGHHSSGFSKSWGSAMEVLDLIEFAIINSQRNVILDAKL